MLPMFAGSRDGNCTRGCGYPRILDPTGVGAGSIFHPWVDLHPHIADAGFKFHPRMDPHLSENKKNQPSLLR